MFALLLMMSRCLHVALSILLLLLLLLLYYLLLLVHLVEAGVDFGVICDKR